MILADTSVWVHHLRAGNPRLQGLLLEGAILTHPFIIGEIACGKLGKRAEILEALQVLPSAVVADHHEVLRLIEERRLWGKGIGWVDAHLLASVLLTGCPLWTLDRRLHVVAVYLRADY